MAANVIHKLGAALLPVASMSAVDAAGVKPPNSAVARLASEKPAVRMPAGTISVRVTTIAVVQERQPELDRQQRLEGWARHHPGQRRAGSQNGQGGEGEEHGEAADAVGEPRAPDRQPNEIGYAHTKGDDQAVPLPRTQALAGPVECLQCWGDGSLVFLP